MSIVEDRVVLKCNGYIHAVELCGECVFEDNFFSMLDGEEKTVKFSGESKNIGVNSYVLE